MPDIPKNPIFTDEAAARAHLEGIRWPQGIICVHCGAYGDAISTVERTAKRRKPTPRGQEVQARPRRPLLLQRLRRHFHGDGQHRDGRQPYPPDKWLYAFHLMISSKKGISSHQLHRTLGVSYKTAWFMTHRIREALR